jgi:hypothetical protein
MERRKCSIRLAREPRYQATSLAEFDVIAAYQLLRGLNRRVVIQINGFLEVAIRPDLGAVIRHLMRPLKAGACSTLRAVTVWYIRRFHSAYVPRTHSANCSLYGAEKDHSRVKQGP